ncbi:MAG: LysR family transcriptional regulator [Acutalibacteraceae bacterium]
MNILHLKYATEIAETKSISKAAENLYMGQPNLSRAIKELEEHIGITIFKRTSKGIIVTDDGEEFLRYARRIIAQVEQVENMYVHGRRKIQQFSISVPRATYICEAFTEFSRQIGLDSPCEFFYKETNSNKTIINVTKEDYNLGIVRYQSAFDDHYRQMFQEKKLTSEVVSEFSYVLVTSENSSLAKKDIITAEDLSSCIEICHADPYVPSMPLIDVKKAELSEFVDKRIFVFERASQMELLSKVPESFMWVSPISQESLLKYGLVEKECNITNKLYKDVLIYRNDYRLSDYDNRFINELIRSRTKYFK